MFNLLHFPKLADLVLIRSFTDIPAIVHSIGRNYLYLVAYRQIGRLSTDSVAITPNRVMRHMTRISLDL